MYSFYSPHHWHHNPSGVLVEGQPFVTDEVPQRVEGIRDALFTANLGPIREPSDHGLAPILTVHDPGFVDYLQSIYAQGAFLLGEGQPVIPETFATRKVRRKSTNFYGIKGYYAFGVGSPILKGTWEAAYWSAQCALSAADRLLVGDPCAYALCRPPGHHAAADLYGGFCYLNNAAIAARYLQASSSHSPPGVEGRIRLAILDIDYHHGNGTQEIFYADPTVLYCSLHAHPDDDYPYFWGGEEERGEGPGEGCNHNFPLPQGIEDEAYLQVLDKALSEVLAYNPRYLIVSFGLDIGEADPVGGFRISLEGFRKIGERIAGLSLATLIVQEGGYLLESLGERALAFLRAFQPATGPTSAANPSEASRSGG